MGHLFAQQQKYSCAADAFGKAAATDPKSSSLAYLEGLFLYRAGRDTQALAPLERARELNPVDVDTVVTLGTVLDRLHRKADAEKEWRQALAIKPTYGPALDALSQSLLERKDYAGVVALPGERSTDTPGSAVQALNLGIALAGLSELPRAVTVLQKGLDSCADSLPIANELAMALMVLGRTEDAYDVFEHALKVHPDDQQTQILYLEALVLSRPDLAEQRAKQTLASIPTNGKSCI